MEQDLEPRWFPHECSQNKVKISITEVFRYSCVIDTGAGQAAGAKSGLIS